jgi:hypothetical protein
MEKPPTVCRGRTQVTCMSTEMIALLVLAGFFILGGVFYINHNLEQAKNKKAVMIGNLSETAHRLQRIIEVIPDSYIHRDLKIIILNEMRGRLEKLAELAPTMESVKKKLENCDTTLKELQANTQKPQPPRITSPQQADEIRNLLQDLSKVIETFSSSQLITPAQASTFLTHVQDSFAEAHVNYMILLGDQCRNDKKWRLAVHHYQKASAEMSKRNPNGRYNERLQQLKTLCDELTRRADEEGGTAKKAETNSELDQAMNEFLEEEESWKKKYF